MKASILALTAFMISSLAHADLAVFHAKKCESAEVKALMGEKGSCRVVITPNKATTKDGMCVGTFMGSLPCAVTYLTTEGSSMMNLTCGSDPSKPVVDQDMEGDAVEYKVTLLIKKENGESIVKTENVDYLIVSNGMIDLNLLSATSAEIGISLESGRTTLTNVICK